MKTITYLIIIVYTIFPASAQWYNLNSGVTYSLNSVFFLDANTGFVVGGNYNTAVILRTTDGGYSWSRWIPYNDRSFRSVYFVNNNVGYVVSEMGKIYKTTIGGSSWYNQPYSAPNNILYSVFFINVDKGYAVGASGTCLHTTNGGTIWTAGLTGTNVNLYSIFFSDLICGYVVGEKGTIIKTSDSGSNWNPLISSTYNDLYSIVFTDPETGYTVGDSGTVLKTTNAGESWNKIFFNSKCCLRSVCFPTKEIGFITGADTVYKTTNAGLNWFVNKTGTGKDLYSGHFINENIGYVSGENGIIMKTMNGGGGLNDTSRINNNFLIYPIPCNSSFSCIIQSSYYKEVLLRIINATGMCVYEENLIIQPGLNNKEISLKNTNPGVYYVYLIRNNKDYSLQKIIKQ